MAYKDSKKQKEYNKNYKKNLTSEQKEKYNKNRRIKDMERKKF